MAAPLPRNLLIVSLVSLLTDLSTEMAFPLLPLFLTTLGGGALALGVMEGGAESVSSFLKYYAGRMSDRWERRKPFVLAGYGFSALVKTGFPFAGAVWHLVTLRSLDRVGKGVRNAPRDALIADSMPPQRWGFAFGLHRSMDTLGAFLGPLVAVALVAWLSLRQIFLVAALPALVGVIILLWIREPIPAKVPTSPTLKLTPLPRHLFSFLLVIAVFTLGNLSIAFLLLRAIEVGLSTRETLLIYLTFNGTYALFALPLGSITDRIGRPPILAAAFSMVIIGSLLVVQVDPHTWTAFLPVAAIFGLGSAGFEGNGRALAVDLAPSRSRARSLGAYHAAIGFAGLPAGLIAGLLWERSFQLAYVAGALFATAALAEFLWLLGKGVWKRGPST